MTAYFEDKYNFIAEFCNQKSCLLGDFKNCTKNHQILQRSISENNENYHEEQNNAQEMVSDNSVDVNETEIFASNVLDNICDSDIEFLDNSEVADSNNPSILDSLLSDSQDENDAINENNVITENSTNDDVIILDDDDISETIMDDSILKSLSEELYQYHDEIARFSSNDKLLPSMKFTSTTIKKVNSLLESFPSKKYVFGDLGGYELRLEDLHRLKEDIWLYDSIMNAMFSLIQEKCYASNIEIDVVTSHWFSLFDVSFFFNFTQHQLELIV